MKRLYRTAVGLSGTATAGLLYSLLFVVLWGDGFVQKVRLPDAFGAGANAGAQAGESSQPLIMIQLPTDAVSEPQPPTDIPVLLDHVATPAVVEITGPDSLPIKPLFPSEEGDEAQASEADLIARIKLMGLYEGQIRARIERAWVKPQGQAQNSAFSCRVKIRQSHVGQVEEVEMQRCNGSDIWQQSLANAVFAASPLPAPPNPAVFVDAFSLVFQ